MGGRWTDSGDGPTPNQCNHSSYRTSIQSEGSSDRRRERKRVEKREGDSAFRCLHAYPHTHPTFLSSPPRPFIDSDELLWVQGYLTATPPRGNSWGSQGSFLSCTTKAAPPESRGPNTSTDRLVLHSCLAVKGTETVSVLCCFGIRGNRTAGDKEHNNGRFLEFFVCFMATNCFVIQIIHLKQ